MKKQMLPLTLCAALMMSTVAFATQIIPLDTTPMVPIVSGIAAQEIKPVQARTLTYMTIDSVTKIDSQVTSITTTDTNDVTTTYTLDTTTMVIDCISGEKVPLDTLAEGMGIYTYVSLNTSSTTQIFAEAIITNMPMDAGCPSLYAITGVATIKDVTTLYLDNEGTDIVVTDEMSIFEYGTMDKIEAQDIKTDSMAFVWYNTSMTPETYTIGDAFKIMVVPTVDAPIDDIQNMENREEVLFVPTTGTIPISLNGKAPNFEAIMKDGTAFIPLRTTATALGLDVAWSAEDRAVVISNEMRTMNIAEGATTYISSATQIGMVGMTAPKTIVASYIDEKTGTLFTPADAFSVLVGFDVVIDAKGLSITATK